MGASSNGAFETGLSCSLNYLIITIISMNVDYSAHCLYSKGMLVIEYVGEVIDDKECQKRLDRQLKVWISLICSCRSFVIILACF